MQNNDLRTKLFINAIKLNPNATIEWLIERFKFIEEVLLDYDGSSSQGVEL